MGKVIGQDYEERKQSRLLRNLVTEECIDILQKKIKVSKEFRQAMLLKLAGNVLPRLNEISGPEGKPIPLFDYVRGRNNNGNGENKEADQENQSDSGRNGGE